VRAVVWAALGAPGIWHLQSARVWIAGRIEPMPQDDRPICGGEKEALVYRGSRAYCRYCVAMEGMF